jgi:DNA repair photolyase
MWSYNKTLEFETKHSKSIIHPFMVKGYKGLTINPYQGCQHRCGYITIEPVMVSSTTDPYQPAKIRLWFNTKMC